LIRRKLSENRLTEEDGFEPFFRGVEPFFIDFEPF
jgi:hypothetical protein